MSPHGSQSRLQVPTPGIRYQIVVDGQLRTPTAMKVTARIWILGGVAALTEIMWRINIPPALEDKMMHGLPSRGTLRARGAVLILLVLLALAACTAEKGPTVTQAGQTLKTHILQALKERQAQNVNITDPGGRNISCAQGKAKQTFAATGNDLPERRPETLRSMLLGTVERIAPYEIDDAESFDKPIRVSSDSLRVTLVLDSPSSGVYAISGETECLALS
ncbi:hypothetical protein [Sphaerisporangium rhizosphaerae]|uniref:DUF4333 domain-containing protein n=1 Tax=Sphaerisporangium rhizosphaerae TaxID=2269375 RepID=A0ABW2NYY9_9ACTN